MTHAVRADVFPSGADTVARQHRGWSGALRASLNDLMSELTVRVFSLSRCLCKFELALFNHMIGIMYCIVNALLLE
jgi:hypothetical protein